MKAYSLDLRQKIVDAYAEGNISQRQLAKQFRVALSFTLKVTETTSRDWQYCTEKANSTNSNKT